MKILGIMMIAVGLILLASARGIYRGGQKTIKSYQHMPDDNDSFLVLLNNGMIVFRIIGGLLLIIGLVFLFI